jgi:hypothetical protein
MLDGLLEKFFRTDWKILDMNQQSNDSHGCRGPGARLVGPRGADAGRKSA